jgi:hypothetical protein
MGKILYRPVDFFYTYLADNHGCLCTGTGANTLFVGLVAISVGSCEFLRAGHVERYQLQSYRF